MPDRKSYEGTTNFWTHFPDGIKLRELEAISPPQREAYMSAPCNPNALSDVPAQILHGLGEAAIELDIEQASWSCITSVIKL